MFTSKTDKLRIIAAENEAMISGMDALLSGRVMMYIDYANVRPWSNQLKWHIDIKRLKQFLDSFDQVQNVNFYNGYLEDDERFKSEIEELEKLLLRRTSSVFICRGMYNERNVHKTITSNPRLFLSCKYKGTNLE